MKLIERIERLGLIGLTESGICRMSGSPEDEEAKKLVIGWMMEAGMSVRMDDHENLIGTTQGRGRPVVVGSHLDTVETAGRYDGVLGVLAGIEAAERLRDEDVGPIEVCVFFDEENSMSGSIGYASDVHDDIRAYLELHVEQGPVLDSHQIEIGVVQGIVGQRRLQLTITGQENHAGTTPMNMRDDALVKAAKIIQRVHEKALMGDGLVATIGQIDVSPNAFSVVPGRVELTLQIRDLDVAKMEVFANSICKQFFVRFKLLHASEPALCDPGIQDIIEQSCNDNKLSSIRMPSRASHDAQNFTFCPMGMIFVPSIGGISHSPKEFTTDLQCYNGVSVLTDVIRQLNK